MRSVNQWIRKIHRWLAIPLMVAIIFLIAGNIQQGENYVSPNWLGALGIGAILLLALTGTYMFFQHYLAKLRRSMRSKRPVTAPDSETA